MTTAQDLLIITLDMPSARPVERGDLSLALAGAELIDLLNAGVVRLADARVLPTGQPADVEGLLAQAAASLPAAARPGSEPHESVDDWLWRRGRGLSAVYLDALEAEGKLTRERHRRLLVLHSSRMVLVDSPARSRAANRWAADEPVLIALAAAVGMRIRRIDEVEGISDDAVASVLAAVIDALTELAGERHRRARKLEDAATDNVQRGY
ncbi:GOLPH3/VPS74 family protein [Streptomyces sp. CA-111067]|uniref:GOLPH3/VPS74 family protein n=1 Tax=Streptomyces sp. CA-111067 TaxID=3240046 RepID=UPI003D999883